MGKFINNNGDWEFDGKRIRHELEKNLFHQCFCTDLDLELVEDVLRALPAYVNPRKHKNWRFIIDWSNSEGGLVVTVNQFGFQQ